MDCSTFAFDLHVLGTPPALILSQDQTLMLKRFVRLRLAIAGLNQTGDGGLRRDNPYNASSLLINWLCVVLLLS